MSTGQVFDFNKMRAFPYEEREKNVFYKSPQFKMRIIELPVGGKMPECKMESYVIFYVTKGSADITVNGETGTVLSGQVLVTGPAVLSMKTSGGVKIMGIQVSVKS
ncbi:MAG: hypothetical protein JW728_07240 [Candidatus Aureabacteria bacterium]|nr:hypothetical protein [Candidatus Auribacterota bacterium]